MTATEEEVMRVLKEIKYIVNNKPDYYVFNSERKENKETLIKLGFRPLDADSIILELTTKDYSKGPEGNESRTRVAPEEKIWFFGKEVEGMQAKMEVYIKISVAPSKCGTQVCMISFHETNKTIHYPYKRSNEKILGMV